MVALVAGLPVVIEDPRQGPSPWVVVEGSPAKQECGPTGFLLPLPAEVSQEWLQEVVALSACGAPLLALGGEVPAVVRPYLDGLVVENLDTEVPLELRQGALGLPLVMAARDGAGAVAALAAGAAAVLAARPEPSWTAELVDLLPAPQAAFHDAMPLPTALRGGDLALVVGLPAGFAGGTLQLGDHWVDSAVLLGGEGGQLGLARQPGGATVQVPQLAAGGIVVVHRPPGQVGQLESLTVTGQRLPEVAEVLARHQRAAARQQRLLPRWTATQRLLLRVRVGELGRSLELALEGPVYVEGGVGADWEIARAWLGGVEWPPERLPDLPLLEAQRPQVPPLAVRLEPSWRYALTGLADRQGQECYLLSFHRTAGSETRVGEACIHRHTFGLVELRERASGLPGEVRATTQVTVNTPLAIGDEVVWLPERVVADDLVTAFGTGTSVHRELTVTGHRLDPPGFAAERVAAYGGKRRMVRDAPAGVVRLVPDGAGGRVPEGGLAAPVRLLLAGVAVDPGLDTPLPFGGVQLADFNFRGRGEQVRVFAAGVVNDLAWSRPRGATEVSAGAFTQLLPFATPAYRRGDEVAEEELKVQRQRLNVGAARALGRTRFALDLELHRWDFGRTHRTAPHFDVPPDTWEGVVRGGVHGTLAGTSLSALWEVGQRARWAEWGARRWQRYHASIVHEATLGVLARATLAAELWGGRHLDRFSAPAPGRFGPLRLRGVPSHRVTPDRLGVVRGALALPVHSRLRAEVGFDAAWVREERSGYRAQPLAGVGVSASLPGPWSTFVELSLGYPLAVPGRRGFAAEVLVLRPLGR
jgi:hypothetical protein